MSKKETYTRGPWSICARSPWDEVDLDAGLLYSETTYKRVAAPIKHGEGINSPSKEEQESNMLLMAAAPDMLKALEALVMDIDPNGYKTDPNISTDAPVIEARAAIKKARGL